MRPWPSIRVLALVGLVFTITSLRPAAAREAPDARAEDRCAVVDIDHIGSAALTELKATTGVDWWLELGAELLVCGDTPAITAIAARRPLHGVHVGIDPRELRLALVLDPGELAEIGATTLARGGRTTLVRMDAAALERWQEIRNTRCGEIHEVAPNTVVARQLANDPPRPPSSAKAKVTKLVDAVDTDRWFAAISTLASWSRNTHGAEILLARDWLVSQFQGMSNELTVTTPSFTVPPSTTAYNVMAVLPGRTRPDDWYVVGGHYDSMPAIGTAPGAEDNASGCAGVLELAHIFTAYPPEATMIFVCYAGEEQWLYGSYDHVDTLITDGDADKVLGMLDMDMIGYTQDATLDAILESSNGLQATVDFVNAFASVAPTYAPDLELTLDWNPCCSDHMPYLENDIPAVLTIEDYHEYPYYHTSNDTPDKIVPAMGEQILRMNVAAMAELAGAAVPSLFRDGFEDGSTSQWSATEPPPPVRMRAVKGKR